MAIITGAQFNNALLEYYPPRLTARQLRKHRTTTKHTAEQAAAIAAH